MSDSKGGETAASVKVAIRVCNSRRFVATRSFARTIRLCCATVVQVRPILPSIEKDTGSVFRYPTKCQVVVGKDAKTPGDEKTTFTYDYVFNEVTPQHSV